MFMRLRWLILWLVYSPEEYWGQRSVYQLLKATIAVQNKIVWDMQLDYMEKQDSSEHLQESVLFRQVRKNLEKARVICRREENLRDVYMERHLCELDKNFEQEAIEIGRAHV